MMLETTPTQASAFFTFEKQAASLSDLDIVRKIVEREGCLEALEQLLRGKPVASQADSEIEQLYPSTSYLHRGSRAARGSTMTASPMVLQSVLDQLRSVSVQIVEAIERWRVSSQTQVFQWRQVNYLLKMARDLDFLAAVPMRADALQQLRLERNPFLAPLHLDHPALRERVPDAAVLLGLDVGSVDIRRVFYASKVLLRELDDERKQQQLAETQTHGDSTAEVDSGSELSRTMAVVDPSMLSALKHQRSQQQQQQSMRVRSSNQDARAVQSRGAASGKHHLSPLTEPLDVLAPRDRNDAMRRDLELARELILHAEHELGAIREEVAMLQAKLADALVQPERRRKLQTKIGALVNTLKFRSGDLYQRKNELRRKEAVYRLACDRSSAGALSRSTERLSDVPSAPCNDSNSGAPGESLQGSSNAHPHAYLRAIDSAMQADELRRQEIVEKFMALAKMRATALSSTSRHKHKHKQQQQLAKAATSASAATRLSLPAMTPDDVATFVDSLDLGSSCSSISYGSKLRSHGIDGALLLQATDRDLEELGVSLRLHRVRILEAVARVCSNSS